MNPTLLVMAAGIGSRYGGLKQVDPVGLDGEAILDYSIYDARRAGFGKVVFVIRHQMETPFKESIGRRFADRIPIDYAYQELDMVPAGFAVPPTRQKPWGTGHAILVAADQIQEPCAVINADDFYGRSSFQILGDHLRSARDAERAEYCMVGFVLRNTLSEFGTVCRGVCQCDREGYLQSVRETLGIAREGNGARYTDEAGRAQSLTGEEIVSMNMWGFTPSIFPHLRRHFARFLQERGREEKAEFFIPTVVNALMDEGRARVKVLTSQDPWFGITYQQDKPYVTRRIRDLVAGGVYPERLWR